MTNTTRYQCAGCGLALPVGTPAFALLVGDRHAAAVCAPCRQRAADSTVFADMLNRCVALGMTVPRLEAAFGNVGLPVPTTEASAQAGLNTLAQRGGYPAPTVADLRDYVLRGGVL